MKGTVLGADRRSDIGERGYCKDRVRRQGAGQVRETCRRSLWLRGRQPRRVSFEKRGKWQGTGPGSPSHSEIILKVFQQQQAPWALFTKEHSSCTTNRSEGGLSSVKTQPIKWQIHLSHSKFRLGRSYSKPRSQPAATPGSFTNARSQTLPAATEPDSLAWRTGVCVLIPSPSDSYKLTGLRSTGSGQ